MDGTLTLEEKPFTFHWDVIEFSSRSYLPCDGITSNHFSSGGRWKHKRRAPPALTLFFCHRINRVKYIYFFTLPLKAISPMRGDWFGLYGCVRALACVCVCVRTVTDNGERDREWIVPPDARPCLSCLSSGVYDKQPTLSICSLCGAERWWQIKPVGGRINNFSL